jgi:hypothetical protein
MYIVAEKWQEAEREIQKKLKPEIDIIKSAFKGDEQYLLISTYYRQNHYHPVYSLRSSLGLVIQIPFFIAAYSYLSHLDALRGISFLFIRDMSAPDGLWNINGFSINVLPLMMTAINYGAGMIYTRGLPLREKVQVFGLGAVFLVLLYKSPAGLVLYWTLNNVFSLVKNIFYKIKNPGKILRILVTLLILLLICYVFFFNSASLKKRLFFISALAVPLVLIWTQKLLAGILLPASSRLAADPGSRTRLFAASALLLALLMGWYIPSAVFASSPGEFSFIDTYSSPFAFLRHNVCEFSGLFLFWGLCLYFLFGTKVKSIFAMAVCGLSLSALIDTVVFSGNYGTISNIFLFDNPDTLFPGMAAIAANCAAILAVLIVFFMLIKNNKLRPALLCMYCCVLALSGLSVYHGIQIQRGYSEVASLRESDAGAVHVLKPVFSLSKTKPNVVVLMADRAISGYVKPVFAEAPHMERDFDGFVYYPNTVSYGMHTLFGAPPLFGGYEYTPRAMNARNTLSIEAKTGESLRVLPLLFSGAGFQVTVTDPPSANREMISDIRIFKNDERVRAMNTLGNYRALWYLEHDFGVNTSRDAIMRNMAWFSLFKVCPVFMRYFVYDSGNYWNMNRFDSMFTFIDSYSLMDFLPELTDYGATEGQVIFLVNLTPHNSVFLQYPSYTPARDVTDKGHGEFAGEGAYHANAAFFHRMGEWLEALKTNGVYDNTRIIIVSDHGANLDAHIAGDNIPVPEERREAYNPVLLVKDFNAHGPLATDGRFMTNADVPVLATAGIIDAPKNPFTGNPLTTTPKDEGVYITINHQWAAYHHNKNTFKIADDEWVFVHDDIFDAANWTREAP